MSKEFGVDVAGALEIARAAAGFEWTWTAQDAGRFAWQVGWSVPQGSDPRGSESGEVYLTYRTGLRVSDPEATFAVNAEGALDLVWVQATDERPQRHGPVPPEIFEEFVDRFRSIYGEPADRYDGTLFVPSVTWVLPYLVLQLSRDDSVDLRLINPVRHRQAVARGSDDDRWADLSERARAGMEFADRIQIVLAADFGRGFGPRRVPGSGPEAQPRPQKRREFGQPGTGSWSRREILQLCRDLGWAAETDAYGVHADGPPHLVLLAGLTAEYQQRYDYGEHDSVHLVQYLPAEAADGAYRVALRECVRLLGTPHLVGGPDAFAKWRYTDTTVELTREQGGSADITLTVRPTHAAEWEEGRNQEYGEYGEDWAGHLWELQPDTDLTAALGGSMHYSEPNAQDWDELGWNLERIFTSLAADLPVLAPYGTEVAWAIKQVGAPDGLARGWFSPTGGMLELMRGGQWEQRMYPAGAEAGRKIAGMTIAALRDSPAKSPGDLEVKAEATQPPQRLNDVRFGIGQDEIDWEDDDSDDDEPDDGWDAEDVQPVARPARSGASQRTHGEWEWSPDDDRDLLRRLTTIAENAIRGGTTAVPDEDRWVVAPQWRSGAEAFRGRAGAPPPPVDPRATEALIGILDFCRSRLTAMLTETRENGLVAIADAAAAYLDAPTRTPSPLGAAAIWVLVAEDYWECCRASFPHTDHVARDILPRFVDSWLACYGLAFAAETVVLARGLNVESSFPHGSLTALGRTACGPAQYDPIIPHIRAHLAMAPEPAYRQAAAHLAGVRARLDTVWARLATSYLMPERQDWVDADLALEGLERYSHSVSMLATSVTRPDQYARFRAAVGDSSLVEIAQLYSMLVNLGPECLDAVSEWLSEAASGLYDMRGAAEILAWIPTDSAYEVLLDMRDNEEAAGALTAATARYPHRALRLLEDASTESDETPSGFDPFGLRTYASAVRARIGLPTRSGASAIPFATLGLMALCVLAYVVTAWQARSLSPTPQHSRVYADLMLTRRSVVDGQVWRVLTGGFITGSPRYLLITIVFGSVVGYFGEALLGRARFAAIFGVSLLGGTAAIMWTIKNHAAFGPTVGVTGALAAMLTVVAVMHRFRWMPVIASVAAALAVGLQLWLNPSAWWGPAGAIGTAVVATLGFISLPRWLRAKTDDASRTIGWLAMGAVTLYTLVSIGGVMAILS
ncbi:DUF6301 family protein [Nocardia sp. NPDC059240]|uniref:DUF6301 family protein n=1 Tax=Nocardia sp. NPDC059240 TaxID=3346786 RepID=UPI003673E226